MKDYTLEQALIDSIKKWKFLSEENYTSHSGTTTDLLKEYPELDNLIANCGMCEYYTNEEKINCDDCLLKKKDGYTCYNKNSTFQKWRMSFHMIGADSNQMYAKKILEKLKEIQQELDYKNEKDQASIEE